MNQRVILVAVAILLPVIAIAVLVASAPGLPNEPAPATAAATPPTDTTANPPQRKGPPATLEEAKERTRARLEQLNNMTQAQWEEEQREKQNRQAIQQMLQRPRRPRWEDLTPDQQLELVQRRKAQETQPAP